ncbi:TetR/AcrR family transcriptional regulator [Lacrimispora amygdalina]|uniref:TetR/AcrR family transcriptional regulator n=1 Tax=Lacrimispora amygdalina TaxID=253257 RepID=UPI000BE39B38|nr:TetR/AcrR family transcriptional regulator [Lacrimispora amygdalina]
MGRPYSDEERVELKNKVKEIASLMFMEEGFKNCKIQDITKKAGISMGGFYTFYKDKEALYEEILRDEKMRIRQKILTIIDEENQTPQGFFSDLANVFLEKTSTNKFYASEYGGLLESLVWNNDASASQDNLDFIRKLKNIWAGKGFSLSASDEEIASAVAALAALCMQKEMIGDGFLFWYEKIQKLILELI